MRVLNISCFTTPYLFEYASITSKYALYVSKWPGNEAINYAKGMEIKECLMNT